MIINVKNSITNAGGPALDVLEKSPGLTVNRQNNTIAVMEKRVGAIVKRNFNFGLLAYKLTYTHNFGNKALKSKKERSTGVDDELKRVHN